jgi:hypothetical protein
MTNTNNGICPLKKSILTIINSKILVRSESDSVAIKGQKEYAINQKKRGLLGKRSRQGGMANNRQKFGKASISGVPPSASFIGVDMNARGFVERIYLNDEN